MYKTTRIYSQERTNSETIEIKRLNSCNTSIIIEDRCAGYKLESIIDEKALLKLFKVLGKYLKYDIGD